jgi:hypothetical protein
MLQCYKPIICKCQSVTFVCICFLQYTHLHIINSSQIPKLVEIGFAMKSSFEAVDRNLKVELTEGKKSLITLTATYMSEVFQIYIHEIS